jgi:carbamoyltransferase
MKNKIYPFNVENLEQNRSEIVVGICSYFHDSSVTIISEGQIQYAAQEERFNRIKNSSSFPTQSLRKGFEMLAIKPSDVTKIVYYEDPKLKLVRLSNQISSGQPLNSINIIKQNLRRIISIHLLFKYSFSRDLKAVGFTRKLQKSLSVEYSEHHLSHAASAFLPSNFDSACIVVVDAVGEMESTTIWEANREQLRKIASINFPYSIGMFYSAMTYYCGFKVNSGEYKLMGLAPFGTPNLITRLEKIFKFSDLGVIEINQDCLTYYSTNEIVNINAIEKILGFPKRDPDGPILKHYMDLAASVQKMLNLYMLQICKHAQSLTSQKNLCLAGGVALNCVSNGKLLESGIFDNVWVQPAAGDGGTSLGAAIFNSSVKIHPSDSVDGEKLDLMKGSFLGTSYSDTEIEAALEEFRLIFTKVSTKQMLSECAQDIQNQKVIGFFQGRMEFGPRSLGARSILGNPQDPLGQKKINLKIKFRESFRPFAPAMLLKTAQKYFYPHTWDNYMLFTSYIKDVFRSDTSFSGNLDDVNLTRSPFPSITHIDFSSRIQIVSKLSPLYELLKELEKFDLPMVINTSFNVRGEPIVESPKDAVRCFMATDLDSLYIGNYIVRKENQILSRENFMLTFEPD